MALRTMLFSSKPFGRITVFGSKRWAYLVEHSPHCRAIEDNNQWYWEMYQKTRHQRSLFITLDISEEEPPTGGMAFIPAMELAKRAVHENESDIKAYFRGGTQATRLYEQYLSKMEDLPPCVLAGRWGARERDAARKHKMPRPKYDETIKLSIINAQWNYAFGHWETLHLTKEQCNHLAAKWEDLPETLRTHKASKEFAKEQRSAMTPSLRYEILQRDGFRCVACGRSAKEDGVKLHVDHIVPVSKGGKTEKSNLQTLCEECNQGKGSKTWVGAATDFAWRNYWDQF